MTLIVGQKTGLEEELSVELEQTRARLLECQKENDKLRETLQNSNVGDASSLRQVR